MNTSSISLEQSKCVWIIDNFYTFDTMKCGSCVRSSPMEVRNVSGGFEWRLELYPNGTTSATQNFVKLHLYLTTSMRKEIWTLPKFSMFNDKNEILMEEKLNLFKIPQRNFSEPNVFTISKVEFNRKCGPIPLKKLIIHCDIEYNTPYKSPMEVVKNPSSDLVLSVNVNKLFGSHFFCDVTFVVGAKEFQAHKEILTAHSPVFVTIFKNNMSPDKENRITITDTEPDVFKEMLRFIYSGNVVNIDRIAMDLIKLADKYELNHLETMCANAIIKNLTVDNVAEGLYIADLYSPTKLKPRILEFIKINIRLLKHNETFNTLKKMHPHLLFDVFETWLDELLPTNKNEIITDLSSSEGIQMKINGELMEYDPVTKLAKCIKTAHLTQKEY